MQKQIPGHTLKKAGFFLVRYSFFILISLGFLILGRPVLFLFRIFHHKLFDYIFVVYPGSLDQVRGYLPIRARRFAPTLSPIGIITRGETGIRGIVLTVPWTIEEIEENCRIRKIISKVRALSILIGASSVALAGRMPSTAVRCGMQAEIESTPFVVGDKGAIYAIMQTFYKVLQHHDVAPNSLGILGYGFLGKRLFKSIHGTQKIVAVDPRNEEEQGENYLITSKTKELASCDVIIVLTASGEQLRDTIDNISPGTLVIDDTHPQIPHDIEERITKHGGHVIKVSIRARGVRFFPRLPKWNASWLPGCVVEALVTAAHGGQYSTQEEFNTAAGQLPFEPLLVENLHEV